MSYPFGLVADVHAHNWSAFSSVSADGVNTRLKIILDELLRTAKEVKAAGGDTVVIAGDLFHQRGVIDPSVLNPLKETLDTIAEDMDMSVVILAGNHDLKDKHSNELGSAVSCLRSDFIRVYNEPFIYGYKVLIPWQPTTEELRKQIVLMVGRIHSYKESQADYDLILHAPVDGVILGLPPHGMTDKELAGYGFKRVFSGHYHSYKDFGNGVYSIGATTQQTWADVGSKAGFLLVGEKDVTFRASHAPSFVMVDETTDEDDLPLIVDGNYVKAELGAVSASKVEEFKKLLQDFGAKGSVITAKKTPTITRSTTVTSTSTLESNIQTWIDDKKYSKEVYKGCLAILDKVKSEVEE